MPKVQLHRSRSHRALPDPGLGEDRRAAFPLATFGRDSPIQRQTPPGVLRRPLFSGLLVHFSFVLMRWVLTEVPCAPTFLLSVVGVQSTGPSCGRFSSFLSSSSVSHTNASFFSVDTILNRVRRSPSTSTESMRGLARWFHAPSAAT